MTSNVSTDERAKAIAIADRLLDEPYADPDDDIRVVCRQFNRLREQVNPWRSVSNGMPPWNIRVLAYAEGARRHSDASWRRNGFVFMVAWNSPTETVGPGWARRFYEDACRQLDADFVTITHWMPLEVPT